MMKSLSCAVAAAFLSAAQAAPVVERAQARTPQPTTLVDTAAPDDEGTIRPHSVHAVPNPSPAQRAADAALFESMSKDLPKLPYHIRSYSVHVVNAQRGAFAPNGATEAYTHLVIGTDPSSATVQGASGVSSTIPVRLIPVVIVGPDGRTYDPSVEATPGQAYSSMTLDTLSPVFTSQSFSVGGAPYTNSQLLDAWVRGERWQYTQSLPNYHLLFSPTNGAALRLTPTAAQFQDLSAYATPTGVNNTYFGRAFVLDKSYLDVQMQSYIAAQGITPDTIPVFVTAYNIMAYSPGVYGYHSNVGTQTFLWHTTVVQGSPGSSASGIELEHELAELVDHPFPTTNYDPGNCHLGASFGYEAADPLEGGQADFTVTNPYKMTYSFQDLTYAGWNEGEFPSSAYWGHYTLNNAFRFPCF